MDSIRDKVEAFKLETASERALYKKSREIEIDIVIAQRANDEAAVAELREQESAQLTEWHQSYVAMKGKARAICAALDINPNDLQRALS